MLVGNLNNSCSIISYIIDIIKKRSDPRIYPCGTPQWMKVRFDLVSRFWDVSKIGFKPIKSEAPSIVMVQLSLEYLMSNA